VGSDELPFVPAGTRWPNGALTFNFTNFSGDLPSTAQRTAVTRAFARWAAVAGLSFTEVSSAAPANIQIGWFVGDHLDGSPFDGSGTDR
jgi:matrixin